MLKEQNKTLRRSEGIKVDSAVINIQAYTDDVMLLSSPLRINENETQFRKILSTCRNEACRRKMLSIIIYIQQNGRRVQNEWNRNPKYPNHEIHKVSWYSNNLDDKVVTIDQIKDDEYK